jgi:2-keto-3-deoxy-L-rhamnonate aldolase RhmA
VRVRWLATAAVAASTLGSVVTAQGGAHLNPTINLLSKKQPVFGLYAPANRRAGRGAPALPPDSVKSPAQLAQEAMANKTADYIFDGSMEGNFDAGYTFFAEFAKGMAAAGPSPKDRFRQPLSVKTPEIAPDTILAAARIAKQLNLGVSTVVFVGVESAKEVEQGLRMMRFKSNGGIRPDDVGGAPAQWGMSEKEYKAKADLWPLNPKGEITNWTIVESKEGLAHIREIAAVKGIGALFPGAGTLRGIFSTTDATGKRTFDEAAWEAAIQSVLSACKEFNVPCGYPATATDIEMRMKQGFSVFVIGWGEPGFKAVDIGRKAAGR